MYRNEKIDPIPPTSTPPTSTPPRRAFEKTLEAFGDSSTPVKYRKEWGPSHQPTPRKSNFLPSACLNIRHTRAVLAAASPTLAPIIRSARAISTSRSRQPGRQPAGVQHAKPCRHQPMIMISTSHTSTIWGLVWQCAMRGIHSTVDSFMSKSYLNTTGYATWVVKVVVQSDWTINKSGNIQLYYSCYGSFLILFHITFNITSVQCH